MSNDIIRISQGNVPAFYGSPQKFQMWWTKFRAFATLSGFTEAIQEQADPMLPSTFDTEIDEETDVGKK